MKQRLTDSRASALATSVEATPVEASGSASAVPERGAASQPLPIRVGTCSDVGRTRSNNEDRLLAFDLRTGKPLAAAIERGHKNDAVAHTDTSPPGVLLMVADGMGGMMAGELASQMCVDHLPVSLLKGLEHPEELGRGGPDVARALAPDIVRTALSQALRETHQAIYGRAVADQLKGMGTTLTAVVLTGPIAWIAQVGDSRAYLERQGEVQQLTRDQTVWESMLGGDQAGGEFNNAPWKNMLMQALGAQQDLQVVVTAHTLEPGDWLLLCSDGLYRVVKPEDMAATFAKSTGPAKKARELVDLANQRGGPDNVSVVICQVLQPK